MNTPQKSRFYTNMPLAKRRAYAMKRLISYMETRFTYPFHNMALTLVAKRVAKLMSEGYLE